MSLVDNIQYTDSASIQISFLQWTAIKTGSMSGSVFGTASYALNARSASWAPSGVSNFSISSSWASSSLSSSYSNVVGTISGLPVSSSIVFIISGTPLTTGSKGNIVLLNNFTLSSWELLSTMSGSISIDIQTSSYNAFPTFSSITNNTYVSMSNLQITQSSINNWNSYLPINTILGFYINNTDNNITNVNLTLKGIKYV
jgi:hypothetical protein